MKLSCWQTGDFEIQIAGLSPQDQVANGSAHYPGSAAHSTDAFFNTAKEACKGRILQAEAGRHLDPCFTEELGRLFR